MSVFVHAQGIKTVHAGGGGGQKWKNYVHVVVECPLMLIKKDNCFKPRTSPFLVVVRPYNDLKRANFTMFTSFYVFVDFNFNF